MDPLSSLLLYPGSFNYCLTALLWRKKKVLGEIKKKREGGQRMAKLAHPLIDLSPPPPLEGGERWGVGVGVRSNIFTPPLTHTYIFIIQNLISFDFE